MRKQLIGSLFVLALVTGSAFADVFVDNDTAYVIKYQFKSATDNLGFSPTVDLGPGDEARLNRAGSIIRFNIGQEVKEYYLRPGSYTFRKTKSGTIELYSIPTKR
jgi:hypothetical protein